MTCDVLPQVIKSLGRVSQQSLQSDWVDAGKPLSSNVGRYKVRVEIGVLHQNRRITDLTSNILAIFLTSGRTSRYKTVTKGFH